MPAIIPDCDVESAHAVIHDTANFSVEIAPLKVGPSIVRHVRIAVGALVPVHRASSSEPSNRACLYLGLGRKVRWME